MKRGDMIIYGFVIIGAVIGLMFDLALAGVLVGLGIGYFIKFSMNKED